MCLILILAQAGHLGLTSKNYIWIAMQAFIGKSLNMCLILILSRGVSWPDWQKLHLDSHRQAFLYVLDHDPGPGWLS